MGFLIYIENFPLDVMFLHRVQVIDEHATNLNIVSIFANNFTKCQNRSKTDANFLIL